MYAYLMRAPRFQFGFEQAEWRRGIRPCLAQPKNRMRCLPFRFVDGYTAFGSLEKSGEAGEVRGEVQTPIAARTSSLLTPHSSLMTG